LDCSNYSAYLSTLDYWELWSQNFEYWNSYNEVQICMLKMSLDYNNSELWNFEYSLINIDKDEELLIIFIELIDLPMNSTYKIVSA